VAPQNRVFNSRLNAKRTAAAAGAFHVRIIELEARAFDGLDVINLDAVEIHRTHLVNRDLESVEIHDLIGLIGLVFKSHVVLETGAASANHSDAQRHRHGVLHAHDFLDLGTGSGSQTNHKFFGLRSRASPRSYEQTKYTKPAPQLHIGSNLSISSLETRRAGAFRQPYALRLQ